LLHVFCNKFEKNVINTMLYLANVTSLNGYRQGQITMSADLSKKYPSASVFLVQEISERLKSVSIESQKSMFIYLLPWIDNISLTIGEPHEEDFESSRLALSHLLYMTIKYSDIHHQEVEMIWVHLTKNSKNIEPLVIFFVQIGMEKRNPTLIIYLKRVLLWISRTSNYKIAIDSIMKYFTPKSLTPSNRSSKMESPHVHHTSILHEIEEINNGKQGVTSVGQLVLILMVDIVIERGQSLKSHLSILLHAVFVQIDHFNPLVREHSKFLLVGLFHSLNKEEPNQSLTEMISFITYNLAVVPKKKYTSLPIDISSLLNQVVDVFVGVNPDLKQEWGEVAVSWATSCPVRHVACRSLQIFGELKPVFTPRMFTDFLMRLSNTISDVSSEVESFVCEIMSTISLITSPLKQDIVQFPQLFWTSLAGLSSCHEEEFVESLKILHSFIEFLNISEFIDVLVAHKPANWTNFTGVQPLLLRGLTSSVTEPITFKIIQKLIDIENDDVVDFSGTRWLFTSLASFPRMMDSLESSIKEYTEFSAKLARRVPGYQSFSKLFESYSLGKLRNSDDFLKQYCLLLREYYSAYELVISNHLFNMLNNDDPLYRKQILKMLKAISPKITTVSEIEPLIRILQMEPSQDALEVFELLVKTNHTSTSKVLFGNKIISRMAKEGNEHGNYKIDFRWPYSEDSTQNARQAIGFVISTFENLKQAESPKTMEDIEEVDSQKANYGEILNTLEDLEEFFSGEDSIRNNGLFNNTARSSFMNEYEKHDSYSSKYSMKEKEKDEESIDSESMSDDLFALEEELEKSENFLATPHSILSKKSNTTTSILKAAVKGNSGHLEDNINDY
jgi:hypothetical protein